MIALTGQPSLSIDEHVMLNQRIMAALDEEGETVTKDSTRVPIPYGQWQPRPSVVAVAVGLIIQSTSNVLVDTRAELLLAVPPRLWRPRRHREPCIGAKRCDATGCEFGNRIEGA